MKTDRERLRKIVETWLAEPVPIMLDTLTVFAVTEKGKKNDNCQKQRIERLDDC